MVPKNYKVINTTLEDLEFIYYLFDEAIEYQKRKNYNVWKGYDKIALKNEIRNKQQFKVVTNNEIIGVFSICYNNPIVWRDKEKGDALYIHLVVVNPKYKGQNLFGKVLNWAIEISIQKKLKFMRIETWASNTNMISYYQNFNFDVVEKYTTPYDENLPEPHRNLEIVLMQYKVES